MFFSPPKQLPLVINFGENNLCGGKMPFLFQLQSMPKKQEMSLPEYKQLIKSGTNLTQIIHNNINNGMRLEFGELSLQSSKKGNPGLIEVRGYVSVTEKNVLTAKTTYDAGKTGVSGYKYVPKEVAGIGGHVMRTWMPVGLCAYLGVDISPFVSKSVRMGKETEFTGTLSDKKSPDYVQFDANVGIGKLFRISNDFVLNAFLNETFTNRFLLINDGGTQGTINSFGTILKLKLDYTGGKKVMPFVKAEIPLSSKKEPAGGIDENGNPVTLYVSKPQYSHLSFAEKKVFEPSVGAGVTINLKNVPAMLEKLNSEVELPKWQLSAGGNLVLDENFMKSRKPAPSVYFAVVYNF